MGLEYSFDMADNNSITSSVEDNLPEFEKHLLSLKRSPSTVLAYRSDIDQLISFLYERQRTVAKKVRAVDLENFRDFLLAQKYTAKSVSRKLNAVKTFFRWMKQNKIVDTDISKNVTHPKIQTTNPLFLSENEYRTLRDHVRADARILAIVELILQTGMRISEVAALKLTDIKGDELEIAAYATQPRRAIPLNEAAKAAITLYMSTRPDVSGASHLFISKTGKPLAVRNIRAAIDRYMRKAGMEHFSVNDLRTTFIIENIKKGVDLVLLSKVAGHKRLSTTERYLSLAGTNESGKKMKLEVL